MNTHSYSYLLDNYSVINSLIKISSDSSRHNNHVKYKSFNERLEKSVLGAKKKLLNKRCGIYNSLKNAL